MQVFLKKILALGLGSMFVLQKVFKSHHWAKIFKADSNCYQITYNDYVNGGKRCAWDETSTRVDTPNDPVNPLYFNCCKASGMAPPPGRAPAAPPQAPAAPPSY